MDCSVSAGCPMFGSTDVRVKHMQWYRIAFVVTSSKCLCVWWWWLLFHSSCVVATAAVYRDGVLIYDLTQLGVSVTSYHLESQLRLLYYHDTKTIHGNAAITLSICQETHNVLLFHRRNIYGGVDDTNTVCCSHWIVGTCWRSHSTTAISVFERKNFKIFKIFIYLCE